MNNRKKLLIIVLAFVLLLGGAYALYTQLGQSLAPNQLAVQDPQPQNEAVHEEQDAGTEERAPENILAPDFTVYDAEGNEVHLSDHVGKPIVLNFWASWCGPCQMEMPDFHEKYLELGEKVNFLMINMTTGRETLESAAAFIEQNEYSFPVFYDTQSDAAMACICRKLPV